MKQASNDEPIIVQHLLGACNAHIALDLGIIADEIAVGNLPGLEKDFNTINEVLASQTSDVVKSIDRVSRVLADVNAVLQNYEIDLIDGSLKILRDNAWEFAKRLSGEPEHAQTRIIADRDHEMAQLGQLIYRPGIPTNALVQNLGVDVRHSDIDPLCGLLNRRAFYRATRALVTAHTGPMDDRCLAVTMVDLDHFKRLNDKHGHIVGDRALITVADVLRDNTDQNAVVARIGGEEFLIADLTADTRIGIQAERLRSAIASMVFGITASVGVASIPLRQASVLHRDVIDHLIKIADGAMYDAKRAGGNQTRHRAAT